jgi:polyisoprenyl-teichoic acid--peptidoglycan teichoic acid transferase
MKRRIAIVLVAVAVAIVFTPRSEEPREEPPAIELHRVAAASYTQAPKQKLFTALIIGSDVREGDPRRGRGDSLHLLVVNAKTGAGTLIGIPRDSYVNIPGRGTDKINASLFFDGPESTVAAVKALSGIHIQYWALIEFSRFRKLVDTLGGVEVNVPYPMRDSFSGSDFKAGRTKMNGTQALAFSRDRHSARGGDFGRSENQGRLLLASLEKFREDAKSPLKLAKYLRAFDDLVESDVAIGELLELAAIGRTLSPDKIKNVVLPGRSGSAGGSSVVFVSPGDLFKKVRDDGVL